MSDIPLLRLCRKSNEILCLCTFTHQSINRLLRRLKILWKINFHESCVTKNERDGSRVLLIFHPQYVSQDSQLNIFDIFIIYSC